MKILKSAMSIQEYSKIVTSTTPDKYEIDVSKISREDLIQCPHDQDTFISGVQPLPSVE